MPNPSRPRPTIGVLMPGITEASGRLPWLGLDDLARERDANLICFVGRELDSPQAYAARANALYELAGPASADGLVLWSSALATFAGPAGLRALAARLAPLPLVSAHGELPGAPSILASERAGMRQAVEHLIVAHGRRRIAFLAGPASDAGFAERRAAYEEALAAHGIPLDPALVLEFDAERWDAPAAELLDQRGLRPGADFDAAAGVNDERALALIDGLQARGVRVPEDVAVVGYDDLAQSAAAAPALATVRPPYAALGRAAGAALLDLLAGDAPPAHTALPPQLVARASCGCLSALVQELAAAPAPHAPDARPWPEALDARRAEIAAALQDAAGVLTAEEAGAVLDGFAAALRAGTAHALATALAPLLRPAVLAVAGVQGRHRMLSALRDAARPLLAADPAALALAEGLLHQARVMVSESAQRAELGRFVAVTRQAAQLRAVSQELAAAPALGEQMDVLARALPGLGIPGGFLALYADPARPAAGARMVLAFGESGRAALPPGGARVPAGALVPPELLPQGRRTSLVAQALHFRDEQIGYLVLEVGPRDPEVYEALREQISGALKTALLVEDIERQREELRSAVARERALADTVRELSSPVLPLLPGTLLAPLIGTLDAGRAQQVTEAILHAVQAEGAEVVLLDITGVPLVDTHVANTLLQLARAVSLLGARVTLVGMRPEIAQSIVGLGVDLRGIDTAASLAAAVAALVGRRGR